MSLLDNLTAPQREAVTHIDGPLLVLAAAGSGKTRVITARIAHLLANGAEPQQILAISFTNKAAAEMRGRVSAFADTRRIWIGTFHATCARILRKDAERIERRSDFAIYDVSDSEAIIKAQLKELNYDAVSWSPKELFGSVRKLKNNGVSPEEAIGEATRERDRLVARLYERYEIAMKETNALDFDDLLIRAAGMLRDNRDILDRYNEQFHYLLVDEFQDTNTVQYTLLRQLSFRRRNICATGDPDQSIYTWRGATIKNILSFEKDFPDAKVVRLEENFRSTKTILRAADELIKNNKLRKEKELTTANDVGEKIELVTCSTAQAEAARAAQTAAEQIRAGINPDEIAVFYRTNSQSRLLEDAMRAGNVPHLVVGAVAFYRRKEVKDILAYARLVARDDDDASFVRVINVPARGIGDVTVKKIRAVASEHQISLYRAARRIVMDELADNRTRSLLAAFLNLLTELRRIGDQDLRALVTAIARETQYKAYLEKLDPFKAEERFENVTELIGAVADYARAEPEGGMTGFLERTALLSDTDAIEETPKKVSLMTLHSAKGLEFDHVMITGLEEGLLPHSLSQENAEGLEEERRLFFVGITRARKRIWLSYARERMRHGQTFFSEPSPFLRELPDDLLVRRTVGGPPTPGTARPTRPTYPTRPARPAPATRPAPAPGASERFEPAAKKAYNGPRFQAGDLVLHGRFGAGRITELYGAGESRKVKVAFDSAGVKSLVLKFANLKKAGRR